MGLFRKREKDDRQPRPGEVFAMILAALQIVLPFVLLILVAALLAYGVFLLLFG